MHQAVDEGDIAPNLVPETNARPFCQPDIAGISNDEPGLTADNGLNDPRGYHRMLFCGVGADDEEKFRIFKLFNRIGHGATAKRGSQPGYRRGVSEPGAVVNIVGLECCPCHLHEEVVFLVAHLG